MNKTFLSLVLILSTFSIIGEPSKRELVEQLFELQNMESTLDVMYEKIDQFQKATWQQFKVKPSEKAKFEKSRAKRFSVIKEEMSWEKFKEPMIGIYIKHYTVKELQDMVSFYKSETGKSMTSKIPLVTADSMAITQAIMKDAISKMRAIDKEMKEELAASKQSTN